MLSLASGPAGARKAALDRAAGLLRRGGVVAFATDTYYAIGADPLNAEAVARVFRIKGRGTDSPLPVLVNGPEQAEQLLGCPMPADVRPLAAACWPGPLTLVLPARRELPPGLIGPGGAVGVRWPHWPAAEELLHCFGGPITGSSANRSGAGAPFRAAEVAAGLCWEPAGTSARLRIIREGPITLEDIMKLTGLPVSGGPAR
jgi:L-threonylcarbamoyladenylate synthase